MLAEVVTWPKKPLLFDLGCCCLLTKFLIQALRSFAMLPRYQLTPKYECELCEKLSKAICQQ